MPFIFVSSYIQAARCSGKVKRQPAAAGLHMPKRQGLELLVLRVEVQAADQARVHVGAIARGVSRAVPRPDVEHNIVKTFERGVLEHLDPQVRKKKLLLPPHVNVQRVGGARMDSPEPAQKLVLRGAVRRRRELFPVLQVVLEKRAPVAFLRGKRVLLGARKRVVDDLAPETRGDHRVVVCKSGYLEKPRHNAALQVHGLELDLDVVAGRAALLLAHKTGPGPEIRAEERGRWRWRLPAALFDEKLPSQVAGGIFAGLAADSDGETGRGG